MTYDDAQNIARHGKEAVTEVLLGIQKLQDAVEVFTARGGVAAVESLKFDPAQTEHEIAYNEEINQILADLQAIAPISNKLNTLYSGADRATMMRLRKDI